MIFQKLIVYLFRKTPFAIKLDLSTDENLPNYFDALAGENLRYWIAEERYARNSLGIKTILDSTLEGIAEARTSHRTIHGVAMYEMLANIRYVEKFQYVYFEQNFYEESREDSDKVKMCLNLGFLKEKNANKITVSSSFKQ